ncbi:S41 family peptidase [Taibaiella soli]|uniref:Peptidase S41 n=1 Tax=Taibaiella soli TaxID=1649169 RepID=A0A2W2BDP8_9BACT|nr:S41 family peptidase [Taibaiella soli]PZF71716.1 peptidase S41 [Taibaiella soli]
MLRTTALFLLILFAGNLSAQPISYVKPTTPAAQDTAFNRGSGIKSIAVSKTNLKRLTNLGEVWGFLKYYHPAVCSGQFNWDAQLFRFLPRYLKASDDAAAYKMIENELDSLGAVKLCKKCGEKEKGEILQADYGHIFDNGNLPNSLTTKLGFIRDNHSEEGEHYYIAKIKNVGNPEFKNEIAYDGDIYPDAGLRLLALYRYWNMIQYFYPYRDVIGEKWSDVLLRLIPVFINAKNVTDYEMACVALVNSIHDGHASIGLKRVVVENYFGKYITPLRTSFIEGKLVVVGNFMDTLNVAANFQKGDVIEKIDGMSVEQLVKKYLHLMPGSNQPYQYAVLSYPTGPLFRSAKPIAHIQIRRNGALKTITQRKFDAGNYSKTIFEHLRKIGQPDSAFQVLPGNIGYIYPALLKQDDIDKIKQDFLNTKGLIIDLRCYPATFMPFVYGQWLKCESSVFAKASTMSLRRPGSFYDDPIPPNGEHNPACYNKKIVIIVNEKTMSQAEYTTMALSTAAKVTVLGSQTAGADGDISAIVLPGDIKTAISGVGIFYPDGSATQRKGVKIDKEVKPTIKGVVAGRDELLEAALAIIGN